MALWRRRLRAIRAAAYRKKASFHYIKSGHGGGGFEQESTDSGGLQRLQLTRIRVVRRISPRAKALYPPWASVQGAKPPQGGFSFSGVEESFAYLRLCGWLQSLFWRAAANPVSLAELAAPVRPDARRSQPSRTHQIFYGACDAETTRPAAAGATASIFTRAQDAPKS